jgi:hypothetical protein
MTLKDQLQEILYAPEATTEPVEIGKYFKVTAGEEAMLNLLAQAYSLKANQVIRRLIRQAAINYSQDGEEIALLKYNQ